MNWLIRILVLPLVTFFYLLVCLVFVAVTIGGVIEMVRR